MPVFEIAQCLGEINCELSFYQLAKLNDIYLMIQQISLAVNYLFIGLCGIIAVVFIWNVLKSLF
jgi:hypothetical protein